MHYTIHRYTKPVHLALAAPGAVDLAVPAVAQTARRILLHYPNPWELAGACTYTDPGSGAVVGALWAWGRPLSPGSGWPVLVAEGGQYRIDETPAADYRAADWAVAGGPVLIRGARLTDVFAAASAGGHPGPDPYARVARVGAGIRPDGSLAHVVVTGHTLAELAAILLELGAVAALQLGPGGRPALYANVEGEPHLLSGSDTQPLPAALVILQGGDLPADAWHVLDRAESTPILGPAAVTAAQMEAFCHAANPEAPFHADLFLTLAEGLGIRGDLAYAQALYETNYFRYTGDVRPWQFNVAGIGATGGGAAGAVFANPGEGILAQLQHLYAYATSRPLPPGSDMADPRFHLVPRGTATTITALNGRWAVPGHGYGEAIEDLLARMAVTRPARPLADMAWQALNRHLATRIELGNAGESDAPGTRVWRGVVTVRTDTVAYTHPRPLQAGNRQIAAALPAGTYYPSFECTRDHGWYRVLFPAGGAGWVSAEDVEATPADGGAAAAVLDPGHGGPESGAGAGGVIEKEVNLALAERVAARLAAAGVRVWLTRRGDTHVSLAYRSHLANAAGGLFVSLHHNAAAAGSGTETYYQGGSEQDPATRERSRALACLLQSGVLAAIGDYQQTCQSCCPPVDRGVLLRLLSAADRRDYYAVLRNTFVPAALLEVAFITHAAERECLRQEAFLDAVAGGIAGAIRQYAAGAAAPACRFKGPYFGL